MSTLKRLKTIFKVADSKEGNIPDLHNRVKKVVETEKSVDIKKLAVPDHLLCLISGDLMTDPVTIESGRTYERVSIE